MIVSSETVAIEGVDAFAVGAASGLLWTLGDLTLAGVGVFDKLTFDDATKLASAMSDAIGTSAPSGTSDGCPVVGPVALGALPFDLSRGGELTIPEVLVVENGAGTWLVVTGVSVEQGRALIDEALSGPVPVQPSSFEITSMVSPEFWRDDVLTPVRDRLIAGELNKVVLARELRINTDVPLHAEAILHRLRAGNPSAATFAVDGFIGASPELLVARAGDVVSAHPLAGTMARATDREADERAAAELAASTKNQNEHLITINWLLDNLLPFCSFVDADPEPRIMSLANVHHLGTRVEGRLSAPAASILDLVAALHPTPALGGDPQDEALAVIAEVEPGDRGRYGGPVGWVDAAGNGEFAVGIRSGQLDGTEIRLWSGVGVVAASDPQAELDETRAKFEAMLRPLLRP